MTFVGIGLDGKGHKMSLEEYREIERRHLRPIKGNIYEVWGKIKFEDDSTIGVYSREGIRVLPVNIGRHEIAEFRKFEGKWVRFQVLRVEDEIYDEVYYIPRLPKK